MASKTFKAAPITKASWIRGVMHSLAVVELGFTHTQPSTEVDVFTKGTKVIALRWGSAQLQEFSINGQVQEDKLGKLQLAQTALGKPMGVLEKWSITTKGKQAMQEHCSKVIAQVG